MRLIEVINRHRNDFSWRGQCQNCGHIARYGDGYADHYYCTKVIPGRYCDECGLNSHGEARATPAEAEA